MNNDIKDLTDQLIVLATQKHYEVLELDCDSFFDATDPCDCGADEHNAKVDIIKKALQEHFAQDQLLPINFDLKCGAKATGKILKWAKCDKDDCIHCSNINN